MAAPGSDPFCEEIYRLESCSLSALTERDANVSAGLLASIDPWRLLGYTQDRLERYLLRSDPSLRRFSIKLDGTGPAAGVLCVRYPWLCGAYIETIAVFPAFQGRGLGREAVEWIIEQTRPSSGNLWVLVSSFNHEARSFYAGLGFQEVVPLPDLVKPGCDEILLRKRI